MAERELARILRQVRRAAAGALTDGELLHRFVESKDSAAFELLVWRHARTVFGVCQRVLGNVHDAEDAFQATILILARKVSTIRAGTSVACWLYKVAYRAALTLRGNRARNRSREGPLTEAEHIPAGRAELAPLERAELRQALDEEVNRLPERFRAPIVLCLLEGRTVEQAAHELGCARGTVASRLARARQRLRSRLLRRGLALTAALAVVHESAAACKPLTLVSSITPSITSAGMGTSPAAATLAREVLHTMLFHSLKFQGAVLAVFVGLVLVGGGLVYELRANAPGSVARAPVNQTAAAQAAGQGKTNTEQEPPLNPRFRTVRVAHPVEREAAPSADFTGRLTAKQTVEVRPTVSGRLEKINFKPGSEVKKGDLLFEIDNSTYRLDVQKAEAELMVTLAKRNQSETELIRGRKLQGAAIGKGDIDKLANQAAADEAGVNAAKVDVERAKLRMDSTRITAPISGRIGRPLVDIGNQVFGGGDRQSVLATITTLDPIGLSFDMDERSFLQYQRAERDHEVTGPGSLLGVGVPSAGGKEGFPMQATLDSFEDQVDPKTGTIRVHAALSNPDKLLLPGMYTRVRMFFGAPRVLLEVPRSALREGEGFSVLVLTDQNRVKERSVKVGVFEGHQLVEEGLRPEDWVVVDDYQHLRPGDRVEPERVTPPTSSTPSKE